MSLFDVTLHGHPQQQHSGHQRSGGGTTSWRSRAADAPQHSEQLVYTFSGDTLVCLSCVLESVADNSKIEIQKAYVLRHGRAQHSHRLLGPSTIWGTMLALNQSAVMLQAAATPAGC